MSEDTLELENSRLIFFSQSNNLLNFPFTVLEMIDD